MCASKQTEDANKNLEAKMRTWCDEMDGKLAAISKDLAVARAETAAASEAIKLSVKILQSFLADGDGYATKCDKHTAEISATAEKLRHMDTALDRMGARVWQVFLVLITLLLSQIAGWVWRLATTQQVQQAIGCMPKLTRLVIGFFC